MYQTDKDWLEKENRCSGNNKQKKEADKKVNGAEEVVSRSRTRA